MLGDIPTAWYASLLVKILRHARKKNWRHVLKVFRTIRERMVLGTFHKLHLETVHAIRKYVVNEDSPGSTDWGCLADGCRNVIADLLELPDRSLHCTIKLCHGEEEDAEEDWIVYTIARSEPCARPAEYGLDHHHLVGHNSSFAAIVGCKDRKNTWTPYAYSCFASNYLTQHGDKYDCSRKDYIQYFKSTLVFPLRYRKIHEESTLVQGFLTFDSPEENAFVGFPEVFAYRDNPADYEDKLSYLAVYHVGGIIADMLATVFYRVPLPTNGVSDNGKNQSA